MNRNQHICSVCGIAYKSYNKRSAFCSIGCKAKSQSAIVDFENAKALYETGLTQIEVAKELKTSQKVICMLFKRNLYKPRIAAKRNQTGSSNSSWKGDKATYAALHYRVEAKRGKPKECSICSRTDTETIYEWANLTGNYQDVSDYARMCRRCHRNYDKNRPNSSIHVPRTL
jgi:hypothetical protein